MMRKPLIVASLLLGAVAGNSAGAQLAEQLDYLELSPAQPTTDPERIVVTEFFSYQCPHCFALDPVLDAWVKRLPEDVVFERVPVGTGYSSAWVPIAQSFHAFQSMGVLAEVHAEIFRAIHLGGNRLADKASISRWVEARGFDAERFSELYDSFAVVSAFRRGEQRSTNHRVFSVPTLAIDGKFRVSITDNGTAQHFERQLAGVDELIGKVRNARRND